MKKVKSILLLVMALCCFIMTACISPIKKVNYENTIYTKSEAIQKIKQLLKTEDIYFFDCDFRDMSSITLLNVSYNLSVSGTLIYDEGIDDYYIDTEEYASVKLVTNYRIRTDSKCFGFSLISSVMQGKMDHYKNDELVYTNPTIIYNKDTYSTVTKLHNNGQTTYQGNSCVREIKVPEFFYPWNLLKGTSVISTYLKIKGSITSWDNFEVLDSPVDILTHYKSFSDKQEEPEQSTIVDLIKYFDQHGYYSKH